MAFYRAAQSSGGGTTINPTIKTATTFQRTTVTSTISRSKSYLIVVSVNYTGTYSPNSQVIYSLINGTLTLKQRASNLTSISCSLSGTTLSAQSTANAQLSLTIIQLD